MAWPSNFDTFGGTAAQGTNLLTSPDHSADHRTLGSFAGTAEHVIGLNIGTPTVNSFLQGIGGGSSQWGTSGTNLSLVNPNISGGTFNNGILGTPLITGGTANSQVMGTPIITGGTTTTHTFNGVVSGTAGFLQNKIIVFNRVGTTGSGDIAYTGVGFMPTSIIGIWAENNSTTNIGIGIVDNGRTSGDIQQQAGGTNLATSPFISADTGGGNSQTAIVKTFDSDGFTLTWTKTGSPSYNLTVTCLCFR